jgi:hypothetical protein
MPLIARAGLLLLARRTLSPRIGAASRAMSHIETDMQEKRRADEDRYVRERDAEALRKLQQGQEHKGQHQGVPSKEDPFAVDEKAAREAAKVPPP